MEKVKESGNHSQAVYTAEEARAAQKNAKLEAGSMLLTESVKQAEKEREQLKKQQEEKNDNSRENSAREIKDTPELSRQSKWFGIEGKLLEQENIKWSLEMEQEAWEALLNWLPSSDGTLANQFEELSRLYMVLLEALLTHTAGAEQAAQKEMLDMVLAQKLTLLMDTDLKELMRLLESTGQSETLNSIRADVYKQTTGERVSGRAASEFFAKGRTGAAGSMRFFMPETSGAGQRDTGLLYNRAGGRSVQVNQLFREFKDSGELQINQRNMILSGMKGGESVNSSTSAKGASYSGQELARANSFAAHINGSGNLFKNPEISARNEEVVGLLAAATSIKGQIYAETASSMKVPIKSALNQFIDYYLNQKGVYKVYYYTTGVYERTKNAQRAMEEGLEYAYKQFLEKKNDEAYRRQAAYSEQAGFFHALRKDLSMEEDFRRGLMLLEKNWKEFLMSIGEEERKDILLTLQKYSVWGQLLKSERERKNQKAKPQEAKRDRVTMMQIIALAAIGAVYILFRLLFG